MFYATLFIDYLKNYMKTRLTYRSDFWVEVFSDFLFQAMNLFFILVVFQHTSELGGWDEHQIIFIYGYFMIPYGVFSCFFNLWGFSERYIVKGEMDRILTRPAHNLVQLILENMDPAALVGSFVGIFIVIYESMVLHLQWTWADPFLLLMMIISSSFIYGGVYISLTAIGFFVDAPTGILPLIWNVQNYGRYPVTIYHKLIQILLTFILPFAFVGFYPASYFLDKKHWSGVAFMTPVVGVIFMLFAVLVWNYGVKRYRGAGS